MTNYKEGKKIYGYYIDHFDRKAHEWKNYLIECETAKKISNEFSLLDETAAEAKSEAVHQGLEKLADKELMLDEKEILSHVLPKELTFEAKQHASLRDLHTEYHSWHGIHLDTLTIVSVDK